MKKETIIISLGGSLVCPDKIDLDFLKRFKDLIISNLLKNKFFIYVGGGKTARVYQAALTEYGAGDIEKDWIGIDISRLNARVVRNTFGKKASSDIVTDPNKKITAKEGIIVGGGWKPGRSTDYGAVLLAKNNRASIVVNLTNIDYVYDKDPNKFLDAKPFEELTWKEYKKIIGGKWTPGLSSPFDPEASKLAENLGIKVAIINGKHLERLNSFLNKGKFIGTIIKCSKTK